jgi:DNA gyrase subunit B/topoisomerase-4 subunit B
MAKRYDETAVQTLDAISHIRLRSGMYIGRLGDGSHQDDGIYILFKEVIDNSIDEFIMKNGDQIDVNVDPKTGVVSVRDYGRGIPLGKVIDCVSRMNTGAKYNDEVFQFSVGLNGVGLKAVNALSDRFVVKSTRDGKSFEAIFEKGVLVTSQEKKSSDPQGTFVEFIPDAEIFKNFEYNLDVIEKRIWHYAYLNTGLKIVFNGAPFESKNGLLDLINAEVKEEKLYEPLHFRSKGVEFAFLHTAHYGESYFSFVNGQYTSDGGTHLAAFRDGVSKAVCEYAKKSFQSVDIREGMFGALLVRVKDPVFESQTKNKLSNTDLKGPVTQTVKEAVLDLLYKNPEIADKIIERTAFNEKLRKELASVRKEAKDKQKKISIKIPKLRDCKYHLHEDVPEGEDSMIFLTEGVSAAASIVASRDPLTQAVYSLRGKPLNVFGMKLDQLYRNEEMYNVMQALNIENGIEGLRYNKVIIATDADVDGMHIRNLLITYFLTYFESMVLNGHLHLLQTPLFKVRYKDKSNYFYSEKEKDAFVAKLSQKQLELTRFKGLGEISPNEFGQFIDENMRLEPVTVIHASDIQPTLEFYMGKNTPERKNFIMQHLIHEESL